VTADTSHRARFHRLPFILGLIALIGIITLRAIDPFLLQQTRLQVFDVYQQLSPRVYEPVPVRVIDIDEKSLEQLGQWPWPRTQLSQLVERLTQLGAVSILFDMVFSEPDRLSPGKLLNHLPRDLLNDDLRNKLYSLPSNDELFAETILSSPVVLGFGSTPYHHDTRPVRKSGISFAGTDPATLLPPLPGVITNLPILEEAASGIGSFAIGASEGAIVRRMPLLFNFDGQIYPGLSIEGLRVAQGASTIIIRSSDASGELAIGEPRSLQDLRVGDVEVPLTKDGHIWLHYTKHEPSRTISAARVMNQTNDKQLADLLAGHIVLVGTSAVGLGDLRATPLRPYVPGVVVHAQALEQMILNKHIQRPDWADGVEITGLVLVCLMIILLLQRFGPLGSAIFGVAVGALITMGSWFSFTEAHLLLDPVYMLLASLTVYLVVTLVNFFQTERERVEIKHAFNTYLAPSVVQQLMDDPDRLALGGESRKMSFIFTDIADFTTFSENFEAEDLVSLLNEYLDGMCNIVIAHKGTIDKFIGDALFAVFNAPLMQEDHAERAVSCALALDKFCIDFANRQRENGIQFGNTRIGVNTGTAVVGNFGGSVRFDYTAIGDAVNTAARLEGMNKYLGTRVCVASTTVELCLNQKFRPVAEVVLKGKTQAVAIFEPIDPESMPAELLQGYTAAYEDLRTDSGSGSSQMLSLFEKYPDDRLLEFHVSRIQDGQTGVRMEMSRK
jgi:adenylate cyclase